jgi:hypothetical protein
VSAIDLPAAVLLSGRRLRIKTYLLIRLSRGVPRFAKLSRGLVEPNRNISLFRWTSDVRCKQFARVGLIATALSEK